MSSRPLVSIVTSVYNGERYLRESIESVLSQEGVDFEFILIDDGSTDGTPEILGDFATRDPRVRVIRHENLGLTRSLIRGCREVRGEFIARHDADDMSCPGRLALQMRMLREDPSLAFVSCGTRMIGPERELLLESNGPGDPTEATGDLLTKYRGPIHGSVMFRKAAYDEIGGYREQFYFGQDSDLWLRLGEIGRLAYSQEFLYEFRVLPTTMRRSYASMQKALGELSHACQAARQGGLSEEKLLRCAFAIRPKSADAAGFDTSDGAYFIGRCLLRRRDPRAREYFQMALSSGSGSFLSKVKTLMGLLQCPRHG